MAPAVVRHNGPYSLGATQRPVTPFSSTAAASAAADLPHAPTTAAAAAADTVATENQARLLRLDVGQVEHGNASDDDDRDDDDRTAADLTSPRLDLSPVASPPYWQNLSPSRSHRRTTSTMSTDSVLPVGAITLRDNDTSEHNDRNSACWAKSVEISDYTVVNGAHTNVGAFVVWNIRVETLSVRSSCSLLQAMRTLLVAGAAKSGVSRRLTCHRGAS
jgi:hypothetical protein